MLQQQYVVGTKGLMILFAFKITYLELACI